MFMASGIPISSFRAVCSSVDKLDKMPWEEIRNELIKEKGIDEQAIDKLGEFVQLLGLIPSVFFSSIECCFRRSQGLD
jgi:histidyl-tRNA synthetase